jgi:hypothetical protein
MKIGKLEENCFMKIFLNTMDLGGVHEVYRVFPDFMEKFLKDGAVFYVAI